MSINAHVGWWHVRHGRRPRVQLHRTVVGHPHQGRDAVEHGVALVSPCSASASCHCFSQSGAWLGTSFCQKPGRSHRWGTGASSPAGRRGTASIPAPPRRSSGSSRAWSGPSPPAGPGTAPCPGSSAFSVAALRSPTRRPCPGRRARPARRRSAAPTARPAGPRSAAGRSLRHNASGFAATSSLVRPVFTDSGMSSGSQPAFGVVVVLVEQQPLLLAARSRPRRTSTNRPASFSPCRSKWRSPRSIAASRVLGPCAGVPRAPVPHDDVATAVLALRDDALEVEVLDRVVLDVHRELARLRVQRRALRARPS